MLHWGRDTFGVMWKISHDTDSSYNWLIALWGQWLWTEEVLEPNSCGCKRFWKQTQYSGAIFSRNSVVFQQISIIAWKVYSSTTQFRSKLNFDKNGCKRFWNSALHIQLLIHKIKSNILQAEKSCFLEQAKRENGQLN